MFYWKVNGLNVMANEVLSSESVFEALAEKKSLKEYKKSWESFLAFFDNRDDFEFRMPTEKEMVSYFSHLRKDMGQHFRS